MKKELKFLEELETKLEKFNKKQKDEIILKYKDIIKSQRKEKKKIADIIKSFGSVDEIVEKESLLLKKSCFLYKTKYKIIDFIKKLYNKIKNIEFKKSIKSKIKKKKTKTKTKNKVKNHKIIDIILNYYKKIKLSITNKLKTFRKKDSLKNNIEETVNDVKSELSDVLDIYSNKNIFESKKTRIIRIIYQTFGTILLTILIFIWLWANTIFIASLFTFLDGVKIYGINLVLLGITLITLWLVIIVNKLIFKKRISNKWSLITLLSFVFIISVGIALAYRQYTQIEFVSDVSEKYSMTRNYQSYYLYDSKPTRISFNSLYKTNYVINYDNKLINKYSVEVKYYECYYNFYSTRNANNLYISLKLDYKNKISVYIDDLKDNKIYDSDELARYTVVITMNEKDKDRIIIE
ncbi:MAG: MFS transporter [Tenericutes bacterium]|nr:MFS transporter [Mycoplasmatota bacterium]